MEDVAEQFAACTFPGELRTHQAEALEAFEAERARLAAVADDADGDATSGRYYLVLPPGAGKTLIGLEAARRIGHRTVVFGPNTAIQAQWIQQWEQYEPRTVPVGTDRDLEHPLTVLTYQAVAVFDSDAEVDEEGGSHLPSDGSARRTGRKGKGSSQLSRLHDNGLALVERMASGEPITLVLDECHHLLEVWGHLLAEIVDLIVAAGAPVSVIGLTATPKATATPRQSELVDELFGAPTYTASAPAVVKTGHIAPYQELAYITEPAAVEREYLRTEAERFAELRTDLLDPEFGSVPFLTWCDLHFVDRHTGSVDGEKTTWRELERSEPELATAALRLHHAELLASPIDATIREEHRRDPTAEDWARLIGAWVTERLVDSDDPRDADAYAAVKRALPAVGYHLTRRGIRRAHSPVDRVLARSLAKTTATLEILAAEEQALGPQLRALVVCDHEQVTARLSARLTGVLDQQAGSARFLLERMVRDSTTALLDPILMTANTVACARHTAKALVAWLATHAPEVEAGIVESTDAATSTDRMEPVELTGRWNSRRWVRLLTRYFEEGHSRVLVGTRGLLGEGWDARGVNVVVDLTTATTPTAVVQIRGRGTRLDPAWPEKVTDTWSVVTVSADHPKGSGDYDRFVAKHDGFLAVDHDGDVISGVPHVDPELSPYGPPPAEAFDALNARMLARAAERDAALERWRIGEPYEDRNARMVRVRTGRPVAVPPVDMLNRIRLPKVGEDRATVLKGTRPRFSRKFLHTWWIVHLSLFMAYSVAVGNSDSIPSWVGGLWFVSAVGSLLIGGIGYGLKLQEARLRLLSMPLPQSDPGDALRRFGCAVADGLRACELSPVGAEAVATERALDGHWRVYLRSPETSGTGGSGSIDEAVSELFATAMDELLSPLTTPRYVLSRLVLPDPFRERREAHSVATRLYLGMRLKIPVSVEWHAVPTELGRNRKRRDRFVRAWNHWVGPTTVLYTGSELGAQVLATYRNSDTTGVTTQMRTLWR